MPDDISASARWERIIKLGLDKVSKNNQATAQELQEENQKLKAELIELKEKKIPEIQKESENKIKEFRIKNKISEIISKHELIVDKKVAELLVDDYLKNIGYKVDLNENEIELLTKDGLKPQNSDKTKNLSANDIISDVLINSKIVRQSNANNQKQINNLSSQENKKQIDMNKVPAGLRKGLELANKNLEQMSEKLPKSK